MADAEDAAWYASARSGSTRFCLGRYTSEAARETRSAEVCCGGLRPATSPPPSPPPPPPPLEGAAAAAPSFAPPPPPRRCFFCFFPPPPSPPRAPAPAASMAARSVGGSRYAGTFLRCGMTAAGASGLSACCSSKSGAVGRACEPFICAPTDHPPRTPLSPVALQGPVGCLRSALGARPRQAPHGAPTRSGTGKGSLR